MVSPNASTGASPKPSAGNRNVASPIAALPRMPIAMPSSIASSTTTISPASNASATWHLAKHSTIPRDRTPSRGRQPRGFPHSRQPEQLLRIAVADLFLIRLRQADRLQHLDGVADVARALLLVERTIGRKQR